MRPFDDNNLRGIGAEIGVATGVHAARMLKLHPQISLLYCVDPYVDYDATQSASPAADFEEASRRLKAFGNRIKFVRSTINEAREQMPPLDFAYIDGDHRYDAVKNDLAVVWPMIKPGGIMGGHDFQTDWQGVIKAVSEFVLEKSLKLNVETPDWWVFRP
jgi:predicted O-methyltransferase YrrM